MGIQANSLKDEANGTEKRSDVLWVMGFLALTGFYYWVNQTEWFQDAVLGEASLLTAQATVLVLSILGVQVELTGSTIIGPAMRLDIGGTCTGIFVFLMFCAAVLPFPAPWKSRFAGLMLGLMAAVVVNVTRTVLIVLVTSRFPHSLWVFHVIVGQVMVIAAMLGVFLWWAKRSLSGSTHSLFAKHRGILRTFLLFMAGYLGGYVVYQILLDSSFGLWVKKLIETHSFCVLSLVDHHSDCKLLPAFSATPVNLVGGCLKSPVVVLLSAVAFSWPAPWWKRVLAIFLGFIPFFYVYHLFRTVLVSLTLGLQLKEGNVVYNFYGQVVIILALLTGMGYLRCSVQKVSSWWRYAVHLVLTAPVALLVSGILGWMNKRWLTPLLLNGVSDSDVLSYDPEQAVSTFLVIQAFLWLMLIGPTPDLGWVRKSIAGVLGIAGWIVLYASLLVLFETFHLTPHKGLLKFVVILLPLGVYHLLYFHKQKPE